MRRRVVITGMGAVTPIGIGVWEFWNSCKAGRVGIAPITAFDTEGFKVSLAAEVKDFHPENYMDPKSARRMEPFSRFAVAAASEAIADAKLDMEKEDPYRVGVSIGSGIGSMQAMEREYQRLKEKGPGRVSPLFIPMMISNMASGNVAIRFGLKGKNINVVTACATGTHSIGEAFRSITAGDAEVMLAGGTEAPITPLSVAGFTALTALSLSKDPGRASIPFDKDRDGFVMGEGSGVLVLEELEHALARGARVYAELAGYGATCDAHHITAPSEDGAGAAKAMEYAIQDAGLLPENIDYINAHGTGTPLNDLSETRAIKLALGKRAEQVKISSTKSMTGHLLGASGGIEAIACVKSIEEGYVHPTAGLLTEGEGCDLDYCKGAGARIDIKNVISNSLGFGGHNASILIRKYEG